jgi:hypothetical protein
MVSAGILMTGGTLCAVTDANKSRENMTAMVKGEGDFFF